VRLKEPPRPELPTPPLALRKWQRQRALYGEEGEYGEDVYASRGEWRAARAVWAAQHGLTVMQWWDAVMDEAQATARTLDDFNAPFAFLPDEDEDDDPRLTA
jgi:hypothetical protein